MTREELLAICNSAFVPQARWTNRDSAQAQRQLGEAYALLRAGCEFEILTKGTLVTDEETVWLKITFEGFNHHDHDGALDDETFYLPTWKRIADNPERDWY